MLSFVVVVPSLVELAIALGFLSGVAPIARVACSLINVNGGISVFKAVYIDRLDLKLCLCRWWFKNAVGYCQLCRECDYGSYGGVLFNTFTKEAETVKIKQAQSGAIVRL